VRGREEADMGPRQEEKHTLQGMKDLKKMRLSFEEERGEQARRFISREAWSGGGDS
jgi:predicted PP-loop superfamily ATPase